jgi:hypothetical protein
MMNFGVLLLPNHRASTTAFVLGVAFLAALDGLRIALGLPGLFDFVGSALVFWCVYALHTNRRRHANKGTGLASLPPILAVLAALIAGGVEFLGRLMQNMMDFASSNGVDPDDVEAFTAALNDPAFQAAWQESITANPEVMEAWMPGLTWAMYGGFWIVIAGFAIWFARMKSAGGAMADLRRSPETVPVEPTPVAPDAETASSDADSVDTSKAADAEQNESPPEATEPDEEASERESSAKKDEKKSDEASEDESKD